MSGARDSIVAGLLQQPASSALVVCGAADCSATTLAPKLGAPAGWDMIFKNGTGWTFVCPRCLDSIEDEYRGGGGFLEARRRRGLPS